MIANTYVYKLIGQLLAVAVSFQLNWKGQVLRLADTVISESCWKANIFSNGHQKSFGLQHSFLLKGLQRSVFHMAPVFAEWTLV